MQIIKKIIIIIIIIIRSHQVQYKLVISIANYSLANSWWQIIANIYDKNKYGDDDVDEKDYDCKLLRKKK